MKKFFCDAYFLRTKIFLEKFFCEGYFLGRLLFKVKNLGKKIHDELFGPYSKKPPGPLGEGVQVPG